MAAFGAYPHSTSSAILAALVSLTDKPNLDSQQPHPAMPQRRIFRNPFNLGSALSLTLILITASGQVAALQTLDRIVAIVNDDVISF